MATVTLNKKKKIKIIKKSNNKDIKKDTKAIKIKDIPTYDDVCNSSLDFYFKSYKNLLNKNGDLLLRHDWNSSQRIFGFISKSGIIKDADVLPYIKNLERCSINELVNITDFKQKQYLYIDGVLVKRGKNYVLLTSIDQESDSSLGINLKHLNYESLIELNLNNSNINMIGISFNALANLFCSESEYNNLNKLGKVKNAQDLCAVLNEHFEVIDTTLDISYYIGRTYYVDNKKVKISKSTQPAMGFSLIDKNRRWHRPGTTLFYVKKLDIYILMGMDEGSYFATAFKSNKKLNTVEEGYITLAPDNCVGTEFKRQGEWFFIPVSSSSVPMSSPGAQMLTLPTASKFKNTEEGAHIIIGLSNNSIKQDSKGNIFVGNCVVVHGKAQHATLKLHNGMPSNTRLTFADILIDMGFSEYNESRLINILWESIHANHLWISAQNSKITQWYLVKLNNALFSASATANVD